MKKSFKETVQAMTGKDIVMAMVNGLRKKHVEINMGTFGCKVNGVCYGCAATNTICEIIGRVPELGDWDTEEIRIIRTNSVDANDTVFVHRFESAIDFLRSGMILSYNNIANKENFASFPSSRVSLPSLENDFTEKELQAYERFANSLEDAQA